MRPNYSSKRDKARGRFVPGPSYTSVRMHFVHGALGLVRLSPFSPPKSSKLGRKVTKFGLFLVCGAELLFETRRDTSEICSRPFLYISANAFRTWGSGFGPFESFFATKIFEIRAIVTKFGQFLVCGAELLFETRQGSWEICSRPFLYIRANAFHTWGSRFVPFRSF